MDDNHTPQERDTDTTPQSQLTQADSDEVMLAKFSEYLKNQREEYQAVLDKYFGMTEDGAKPIEYVIASGRLESLKKTTPELMLENHRREERQKREHEEAERRREQQAKCDAWRDFLLARGRRYEKCRLSNYVIDCDRQQKVVDAIRGYCETVADKIAEGVNLILIGPSGTGKDHLITAVVRAAVGRLASAARYIPEIGITTQPFNAAWFSGASLFGQMRAAIKDETETDVVDRYASAELLSASDLIPPSGRITDFQSEVLYRIFDERYNHRRPTLLSVNVGSRQEMDSALGVPIVDRLVDGAIVLTCDWPSYRKSQK